MERDTITLIRYKQHLWSECCTDKLSAHATCSAILLRGVLLCGDFFKHLGDSGSVLGVEVCVDFVKEVEWSGIALLDSEDEREGAETYGKGGLVNGKYGGRLRWMYSFVHHSTVEYVVAHHACY
jgi:hypothetical protein